MTSGDTRATTVRRLEELDFLKSIFILLMIAFHLVYFGDMYPYAKRLVYTFHMPGFLLLSGFLMNMRKPWRQFAHTIGWYVVPYLVMESGYTVMASLLPIREHIDHLTLPLFLDKLLLHPLGPYWYLHTLILCGSVCYALSQCRRLPMASRWILCGLAVALLARLGLVSLPMAGYFLCGAIIRQSGGSFLSVFPSSWLAVVPLALLATTPDNLSPSSPGGMLIVWLVISWCLALYPYIRGKVRSLLLFLGRNTLLLFLFSPVFTILCKAFVPWLSFDPSGLLFLLVSITVCVTGSLLVGVLMDRLRVSPYLFGKERIVSSL